MYNNYTQPNYAEGCVKFNEFEQVAWLCTGPELEAKERVTILEINNEYVSNPEEKWGGCFSPVTIINPTSIGGGGWYVAEIQRYGKQTTEIYATLAELSEKGCKSGSLSILEWHPMHQFILVSAAGIGIYLVLQSQ